MKIIKNEPLIQRNRKIGNYTMIATIVLLVAGVYLSFQQTQLFMYALVCMFAALIIQQVSIFFSNRFGRTPRTDELIDKELKGLDDKYTLYHYKTPVAHFLLGPAGAWIIAPYFQAGSINFDEKKNRWVQKGGNVFLKTFGQEGLGRPDLDIKGFSSDFERFLKRKQLDNNISEIKSVLVFFNPKAVIENAAAPIPAITIDKLKDFIRRNAKQQPADMEKISLFEKALPEE
jgi:hypothetical protein